MARREKARLVAGSDGVAAAPPKADGLQVSPTGQFLHPDLAGDRKFTPDIESIVGEDERIRVEDTTDAPWRKICQLSYKQGRFPHRGSGWLVGPRTIVTAGHCVLSARTQGEEGWSTHMAISPGRADAGSDPDDIPFGRITQGWSFSAHPKWISERKPKYDIGCIHLDAPVDAAIGWFGYGFLPDDDLVETCVNIAGYPVDGPNGTRPLGMIPYFHNDLITETRKRRLFYTTDTMAGQSGAPVWLRQSPQEPPLVVGVHAYGTREGQDVGAGEANSATRITDEIIDLIESWVEADGGRADPDTLLIA